MLIKFKFMVKKSNFTALFAQIKYFIFQTSHTVPKPTFYFDHFTHDLDVIFFDSTQAIL